MVDLLDTIKSVFGEDPDPKSRMYYVRQVAQATVAQRDAALVRVAELEAALQNLEKRNRFRNGCDVCDAHNSPHDPSCPFALLAKHTAPSADTTEGGADEPA